MGLFDTLLGRTKPVQADLDALFGLPAAAITLESASGMTVSGHAGVCYKPPSGQGFTDMQSEVGKLLSMDTASAQRSADDAYGYHWVVIDDTDVGELVNQVHVVNSSLADAGWGPQLLCSVFGLAGEIESDAGEPSGGEVTLQPSTAYLVYLFKRGTFYPFVPTGAEQRDTATEMKLKSLLADDLAIESDLDRWFPLWDLPVS